MKKKILAPVLIATTFTTLVGTFMSSLAWFNNKIKVNPDSNLIGYSDGAYFAYGEGTSEKPFGIKTARHLYNLAWLQYIGYFNRDEVNNSTGKAPSDGIIDKQFYFELADDIDMTGWTIPPIGTSLYPFVGNLAGNNHKISNLTTSNLYSDYNKMPSVVKAAGSVSDIDIVGFFGVVGTMGNTEGSITAGGKTYTYSTSAVSASNFGLDNYTAKTVAANTLVGLVVGYMNGPISGVAVKDSKISTNGNSAITSITNKLSDYSLAGYVKQTAYRGDMLRKDVQAETPTVENETQSGSGDEFGASIAMKTMYDRLLNLKQNASSFTYNTSETYYDGVIDPDATETETYSSGSYNFVGNSETDDQGHTIAKYSFYDRGSDYDEFMYLYGDKSTNYSKTTINFAEMTAAPSNGDSFYIHEGTNYLRNNNGTISNTTRENATLWTYNNGKIYNGTSYLRNNSGTLVVGNSYSTNTTWTISYTNNKFYISSRVNNTDYYIAFMNQSWEKLKYVDNTVRYYFSYDGNYMKWGGVVDNSIYAQIYSTTDTSLATEWCVNNNGYYYPYGYSNYTLGYYSDEFPCEASHLSSPSYTYIDSTYLGSSTKKNNYYYFVKFSAGATYEWTYTRDTNYNTARSNATPITRTQVPIHSATEFFTGLYKRTSTNSTETFTTNATYFPLSYEENVDAQGQGLGTYNNNIAAKNTGYVVSGTNYTTQPSDMRVSEYAISNLSNACNGNTYAANKTNVVTINAKTGTHALIEDNYNRNTASIDEDLTNAFGSTRTSIADLGLVKYTASRNQLHSLLNGANNVYGLHFMNAAISPSNKITVPYASINGVEYTDYELPRDSIDFNLKNNGFINFFAGTYFSGNTTFFSLHNIMRDENNNISDIKEISKIYLNKGEDRKTYRYTYLYTDGTYNTNTGTHNESDLLFNMDWVKNPTMVTNALYYYEIPANKGEYALGSVSGKNGAYLIYLDIGAGVKTKNITTYTEKITTTTETFEYLKGMDFVAVIPNDLSTIVGGTVANIGIPASASGNTTFAYNASTKVLTCGPPTGGALTSSYISNDVTVTVTGVGNLTATSVSTSTTILDKVTTITYDNEAETLVKVVTTQETIDGVVQDEVVSDPEILEEGLQEYEAPAVIDGTEQIILHFHYQVLGSGTVTITSEYDSETDTYSFTITSDTAIIIYVDDVLESYTAGGVTTDYTVKINGSTVADNDVINIAASN